MRALRRKRKETELAALANGEIIVKIGKRRTPKRLKLDPTSSIPNPPPVCIVQVEEEEQEGEEIFQDDQDQEEVDYITRLTTTTSSYVQEEDTRLQDHNHSLPIEEVADNDCPPVKILPEVESPEKQLLMVQENDEIQVRLEEGESRDEPVQGDQEPESTQEEEPQTEFFNLVQEMNDILWAIPPQQQVAAAMECLKYVKMVARTIDLIP